MNIEQLIESKKSLEARILDLKVTLKAAKYNGIEIVVNRDRGSDEKSVAFQGESRRSNQSDTIVSLLNPLVDQMSAELEEVKNKINKLNEVLKTL